MENKQSTTEELSTTNYYQEQDSIQLDETKQDNSITAKPNRGNIALKLCYIALFTATLSAGKFVLSYVPNVEIVTLLIMVYATVFGIWYVLPATIIFCLLEMLLYGFGYWVIAYLVYWPLLGATASLLLKKRKLWLALIYALVFTVLFGLITTTVDTFLATASSGQINIFGKVFIATYLRGGWFYLIHIVSNCIMVAVGYLPLCKLLTKIKKN